MENLPDPTEAAAFFRARLAFTTGPSEVEHLLSGGKKALLVDVRAREDFEEAHIPGAISLPREEWEKPAGLSRDNINIFYCYSQTCQLAARAALHFAEAGYPVQLLEGGFASWRENRLKIEGSDIGRAPAIEPWQRDLPH
jgi:rhodanese-related sulfurtransferase